MFKKVKADTIEKAIEHLYAWQRVPEAPHIFKHPVKKLYYSTKSKKFGASISISEYYKNKNGVDHDAYVGVPIFHLTSNKQYMFDANIGQINMYDGILIFNLE